MREKRGFYKTREGEKGKKWKKGVLTAGFSVEIRAHHTPFRRE
jgi:hypothetical protein